MDLTESVTLVRRRLGDVLFVDFEFDGRDRIAEVGAVFGDERYHWTDATDAERKLASLAARATFVAGHNVHAHDLPILTRHWPRHPLLAVRAIDTLLWSPIAFPERPYHRLVKDRELVRLEGNDPLADADASRKVLADELAWLTTRPMDDAQLPLVRRGLIDHVGTAPWRGGAEAMLGGVADLPLRDALTLASRDWRDQVCLTALARLGQEAQDRGWRALGCAYASRWLTTPPGSVLPPWVWRTLPEAREMVAFLRDQDCGACAWCAAQHSPEGQLRRWFGHPAFRDKPVAPDGTSLQRAIVAAGLRDESQFAVLPTGGGKSICFQVPAFARYARRGALTVVISPLQSLMKDQVDNLVRNTGTAHVAALYGALTLPERQDVMERVRQGEVGLLYVSPEQLRNPGVRKLLESREIGSWVFDEAHCIAEWGHDFRPDFWYAPRFVRELAEKQGVPVPPIAAFTATAQPEVVRQILERIRGVLGIELTRFDGGAERTNLDYRVEACPPRARLGRVIELLEPLRNAAGAAVVFAPTRKECERAADELVRQGWAAAAYHAGLETKLRRDTQDRFLNGDLRVIAATSAFGMGVDKADVRLVIHMEMPSSLESYLQQAGRAGRDGQPAECVLLHVPADLERLLVAENRGRLRHDEIQRVLRAVRKFSKRGRTEITPGELARLAGDESADDRDAETRSVTAVAWLERAEILRRDENRPRVFQGRPRIRKLDEARRILEREGIAGAEADAAIAMLQALWQRRGESGSADDLAQLAGLCHSLGMAGDAYEAGLRAIELLERMVRAGILAEGLQLSASVAVGAPRSSQALLEGVAALQRALLDLVRELHPDPELGDEGACELDVVALCRELVARGAQDAVPDAVRRLLQAIGADKGPEGRPSWALQHAGGRRYRVRFDVGWDEIVARVRRRLAVSSLVLETLTSRREEGSKGSDVAVEFAFTDLTDAITADMLLGIGTGEAFAHAERALLFLHDVRVIELRNGLAVFRSAMNIKLQKDAQRRRFSKEDYEPLLEHYESRKVQVHAMNVYAVEGVKSAALGRQVARDWFTRTRKDFQARWLREALAADRAKRILNVLDDDQQRIVRAPPDRNLVVVAGPGSGKTTTVVHRVAWLVHEHDVRPEGVLVLCYNRATASEIRERLRKALGELGTGVTVLTLHALALRLTGTSLRTADDGRFDRVLREATELLRSRDERPCLGADELRDRLLGRWTHLFVDEYQDVDEAQAELIDALVQRRGDDEDGRGLVVFAVGDDDQNIYSWRGARNDYLRQFESRYTAERVELLQNYRSTRAIVEAANALIAPLPSRLKVSPGRVDRKREHDPLGGELEQDAHRGRVVRVDAASEAAAARFVAEETKRLMAAYPSWAKPEAFAVLARHHNPAWRILDVFRAEGQKCRIPVPARPPMVFVREVVALVEELERAMQPMDAAGLDALVRRVRGSERTNPWWDWIEDALREWKAEVGESGTFVGRSVAESLAERAHDERKAPDLGGGIHLGTQHGAKGLQWPVVFALGDVWPGDLRDEPHGERRLAYVAMTRAQKALYLVRWPGCVPHWAELPPSDALVSCGSAEPHPAWRGVDRVVLGLGDVWLDFAGQEAAGHRVHRALERLRYGSKLVFDVRERVFLLDASSGDRVGALSAEASERLRDRLQRATSATVVAMVRRTKEQTDDSYRKRLCVDRWWVPIVIAEVPSVG